MPEGRIILVRHGETDANVAGCFAASNEIELTEVGNEQAQQLALTIQRDFHPTKLLSSEFRRARQTAEIIGQRLGLEVQILPGIHERDFGSLRGQPYRHMGDMMRKDPDYEPNRRWLWTPSDGESLENVRRRAIRALRAISATYPEDEIIVVTHGAVMESVSAHLAESWETACVPPNCSMMLIEHSLLSNTRDL